MSRNRRKNTGYCWRCGHQIIRIRGWGWVHRSTRTATGCGCVQQGGCAL